MNKSEIGIRNTASAKRVAATDIIAFSSLVSSYGIRLIDTWDIMKKTETLQWIGGPDGHLRMIDQTRLPVELVEIDCHDVETVWEAIKMLRVRGAPAIGIAAAYGVCLGLQTAAGQDEAAFFQRLEQVAAYLATSRPTAVNLFWALDRMKAAGGKLRGRPVRGNRWPACCKRPGRSTKKIAPCAGPSASMGRSCWPTARAFSRTATPAGWRRPNMARRWPSSSWPRSRASG